MQELRSSSDMTSSAGLSSRSLSAGSVLSGAISSEHFLQITSEDFVTCGVDERIHTEAEIAQCNGQKKPVAVHGGNL